MTVRRRSMHGFTEADEQRALAEAQVVFNSLSWIFDRAAPVRAKSRRDFTALAGAVRTLEKALEPFTPGSWNDRVLHRGDTSPAAMDTLKSTLRWLAAGALRGQSLARSGKRDELAYLWIKVAANSWLGASKGKSRASGKERSRFVLALADFHLDGKASASGVPIVSPDVILAALRDERVIGFEI